MEEIAYKELYKLQDEILKIVFELENDINLLIFDIQNYNENSLSNMRGSSDKFKSKILYS